MFDRCRSWRKKLTAFAEGTLPYEAQNTLISHLSRCKSCQKALEADEALRNALNTHWTPPHSGTQEFELKVLNGLRTPLPTLSQWLGRLRLGAQYAKQLIGGAVVASVLTGFCFFTTLHAPPQKTKTRLSETLLVPQTVQVEPPVPLSTLLQNPTPRAALLWTAPTRKEQKPTPQKAAEPKKNPLQSGSKANPHRQIS